MSDTLIYYYIWFDKEGKPNGWLATDAKKITMGLAKEVTKEDFVRLGGDPDRIVYKNPYHKEFNDILEENKLLNAQIGALTDYQEFLEDCIAEMAMVIYN